MDIVVYLLPVLLRFELVVKKLCATFFWKYEVEEQVLIKIACIVAWQFHPDFESLAAMQAS